jgi:hypothetical protein
MIHHLNALRLAGLVHVKLEAEGENAYTSRRGPQGYVRCAAEVLGRRP